MKPDAALAASPPTRSLRPNGFLPMSLACRNTSRVFRTPPHARSRFHHAPDARHHPPQWHLSTRYQLTPLPNTITNSPIRTRFPSKHPCPPIPPPWPRPPLPFPLLPDLRGETRPRYPGGWGSGVGSHLGRATTLAITERRGRPGPGNSSTCVVLPATPPATADATPPATFDVNPPWHPTWQALWHPPWQARPCGRTPPRAPAAAPRAAPSRFAAPLRSMRRAAFGPRRS